MDGCILRVQVSVVGLLFLCGLYISSVCSGMGGIYGAPRILQCIANDGTIPIIRVLSKGVCSLLILSHKFVLLRQYNCNLQPSSNY